MAKGKRNYTRVAVVQLDVHPAAVIQRRMLTEDPLFAFGQADSLEPGSGVVPQDFEDHFQNLRKKVRDVYNGQLKLKLLAILQACRDWNVRIVVFPEYSIPYEILGPVSDATEEMVVVAVCR